MRFTFLPPLIGRVAFFLFFAGISGIGFTQTGTISGTVTDSTYKESLPGTSISIVGLTAGTQSDMDGKYSIKLIPGTYSVKFSSFGYKDSIITNVDVKAGEITEINLELVEDVMSMDEVEIFIERSTNTEEAVIDEVKKSDQVVSGISSAQINKSQDRDAGQAMQRIPGVTLINGRFIMIRGLSERYNSVMINDAISPSTEVDRRTFAFDLIPSNMLDRMLVYKSGAAELPGDFAGGVIKIYTRNVAPSNDFNAGLTFGYRSATTFKSFFDTQGSSTDFLGFGSGYRSLPDDFPQDLKDISLTKAAEATRTLNNNWALRESKAHPDIRFNMGFSKNFFLGKWELGTLGGLNYSNTFQYRQAKTRRYLAFEESQQASSLKFDFVDDEYSNNVRLGFINNWSLKFNSKHKIEFKNMFNQLAEEETIIRNGMNTAQRSADSLRNYSFGYYNRSIYSGQLGGAHKLSEKTSLNWVTGLGYLNSKTPDLRRAVTYKEIGSNNPYTVNIPPTATTFNAARFFSNLNEYTMMHSANLDYKFFKEEDSSGISMKVGYYTEFKSRNFQARWMAYKSKNSLASDSLSKLPLDQVFDPRNIDVNNGFYLDEGTNTTDTYEAQNLLTAAYASVLIPYKNFNVASGLRVEYNKQSIQTQLDFDTWLDIKNPLTSLLPFINLSYNLTKKALLRVAYSKTLNRPEFRERVPFLFYDFQFNSDIVGNPDITVANIHNYDARWEYYPSEGETFSVGIFYKQFINPIETYILQGADNPIYTFGNAPKARNYGIELELRKSLLTLSQNKFLQNISLVFNGSLINSEVNLGSAAAGQEQVRALQGQSPYVVNAGVYYIDEDNGIMVNALYNIFGKRIFIVGDNNDPTVYEMPRHAIDLTFTKTLGKHFEARLGVNDLLNYQSKFLQDSNRDMKITSVDEPILLFKRGAYYTAGINFKL